jgi:hypothetical protein
MRFIMCRRTDDICGQLQRYGGVCSDTLLDVLDVIVTINDDLCHGRHQDLIKEEIEQVKGLLDKVLVET